jgi:hypothetical protein
VGRSERTLVGGGGWTRAPRHRLQTAARTCGGMGCEWALRGRVRNFGTLAHTACARRPRKNCATRSQGGSSGVGKHRAASAPRWMEANGDGRQCAKARVNRRLVWGERRAAGRGGRAGRCSPGAEAPTAAHPWEQGASGRAQAGLCDESAARRGWCSHARGGRLYPAGPVSHTLVSRAGARCYRRRS